MIRTIHLLLLAELLLLVGTNALDLGVGGARSVKDVAQPLLGQVPGKLNADDPLAEAEDLAVVGQDGALDGEGVVAGRGSDALDLVGCNGNTQTGTADEQSSVGFASLNLASGLNGEMRVGWCSERIQPIQRGGRVCRVSQNSAPSLGAFSHCLTQDLLTSLVGLVIDTDVLYRSDSGVLLHVLDEDVLVVHAGL